ncbi:MAG: hypothetical protein H7222_07075 [Methylotenera sp.]|nr:hypothetical protein [Oligoflexia bacterium]
MKFSDQLQFSVAQPQRMQIKPGAVAGFKELLAASLEFRFFFNSDGIESTCGQMEIPVLKRITVSNRERFWRHLYPGLAQVGIVLKELLLRGYGCGVKNEVTTHDNDASNGQGEFFEQRTFQLNMEHLESLREW